MRCFNFRFNTILAAIATTSVVTPAQAQRECKDRTVTTINGTIGSAKQVAPSEWIIALRDPPRGECIVHELSGKGRLPAACSKGRSVRASGEVFDAWDTILLLVRSISCQ